MAFIVLPEFKIQDDKVDAFKALIALHCKNSVSKEEGCIAFDSCQDNSDPTRFVLYEAYLSQEAFDIHKASDHYKWFAEESASLIVPGPNGPPQSVRFLTRNASGAEG